MLAIVGASLMACSGTTGPSVDPASVPVDFVFQLRGSDSGGDENVTTVEADSQDISITATISTGDHGYWLHPTLSYLEGGLELRVTAESEGGISIPALYEYRAVLRGVPAGEYELRVIHDVEGTSREAYRGTVTVPGGR
jgi:hypothetical protein